MQLHPVQMVGGAGREFEEGGRTFEDEIADVGTPPLLINKWQNGKKEEWRNGQKQQPLGNKVAIWRPG